MENNKDSNAGDMLNSLSNTANELSKFLVNVQRNLSPDQRAAVEKELGGSAAFNSQMGNLQKDLTNAMKDINKFTSGS
jgi:hypothetical protein